MATPAVSSHPSPDHLITLKVFVNEDSHRRFKLPLRDLRATVLPQKLRALLGVAPEASVIFERYSDSAAAYVQLDSNNSAVYKQLYRAAKAKSKLRLKATIVDSTTEPASFHPGTTTPVEALNKQVPRHNYLETVLSSPIPAAQSGSLPSAMEPTSVIGQSLFTSSNMVDLSALANPVQFRKFEPEEDSLPFPSVSPPICEDGDYDLCPRCVTDGASCLGEGHWLIKRSVVEGVVTNSTTETIPPRRTLAQQGVSIKSPASPDIMAPAADSKSVFAQKDAVPASPPVAALVPAAPVEVQTTNVATAGHEEDKPVCNGCCNDTDESNLVRCNDCEDYDLCLRCLLRNKHGHHPGHTFHLGTDHNFCLKNLIMSRCLPGRQFKHAAICDGCEKHIHGTRHKCLTCPDWDYCRECFTNASQNHPGHRFAPLYEAIQEPPREHVVHHGIFCDGPLCKDKPAQSYITGDRYKCAMCDDLDFCASCEALPTLSHNRTHPLIKFRTPVRSVAVSTAFEDTTNGNVWTNDKSLAHAYAYFTADTNTDLQDTKSPVEQAPVEVDATKPAPVIASEAPSAPTDASKSGADADEYQAFFMGDTIADGTQMPPGTSFTQTFTLYNPGPHAWPVGCYVHFVGGDSMLDVDTTHPSSMSSIGLAMESNKLTAPVEPGKSAAFTVYLRSPQRDCIAISYWRLKLPNGAPIGHRLWCDIQVRAQPVEVAESTKCEAPSVKSEDACTAPEPHESGMIFPKLEKESPESSTHNSMAAAHPAPTVSSASEGDVLEDVESLTLDDAYTDAGFLTDEEYDVLDASDQEFLEAKQSVQ
ncbi:Zinc finger ZZ-type [Penicillium chermesinum]|uniref:Zinc finger ZZ-type n=1 Tax=Penicillium chermesinum TaxID=63820 RepID=A0A9W9NGY4_9EURO|nr:Zinc finger ZZ-type [Penicillium chermesinum]KAJ5219825.1 Zinc finger ZZ-type [Penicillium chermesinum]